MTEISSAWAAQAWTTFWASQGPGSRCLASAPAELVEPLDGHWRSFSATLPEGAKVLDLGCGAGAVGRELLTAAPQLQVTGIDIAIIPQSNDRRMALLSCTPMELLPFADEGFAAVVSQFGYEYGNTLEAAAEAARVLSPGALLSMLVHHSDSPVVAGMRLHKRALEGLSKPALKSAFLAADPTALNRELAILSTECRGDPIIEQAAVGLRAHIGQDRGRRTTVWDAVEEALEPERLMLAALDHFSIGREDVDYWTGPLREGFDLRPPRVVITRSGLPMAWAIEGGRR